MGWARLLIAQLKTKDQANGELAGRSFRELDRAGVRDKERGSRLALHPVPQEIFLRATRPERDLLRRTWVDWLIQSGRLKTGEAQRSAPSASPSLSHGIFYLFFFWRLTCWLAGNWIS
jgi:hypothetical protein